MKKLLMSAVGLSMKKVAFAILSMTLFMLVAAPAWAQDVCSAAGAPAPCGVTITISGTPGNLSAIIAGGGRGTAYDGDEDQIVGVINNSSVKVGAIILNGSSEGEPIFGFDTDGPVCFFRADQESPCTVADPVDYQGPNNTFIGISSDLKTGKVLFTHALAANTGTTWFALEDTPATVVAIGESQTLTAGTTAIYKFGPGNPSLHLAPGSEDDFKITPLITNGISPSGDNLTVTPVVVNPSQFGAASPFQNLACLPYQDYSVDAGNNSVCVEIEVDCTGDDSCNFQNSIQMDYGVFGAGVPSGNLIGGPHLLVHHGATCPDTGFDTDIFSSYTGAKAGDVVTPDPPPIKGGSRTGPSCYVSAFDPTIIAGPQLIQPGQTVGFPGFQPPVSNSLSPSCQAQVKPLILPVNCILIPLPVLLSWVQTDALGNKITNLKLCKTTSCSTSSGPWVNLSLTALTNTAVCKALATTSLPSVLNSGLVNLGKGQYAFLWNTLTNPNGLKGCQVQPVLIFSSGAIASPAEFVFAN